MKEIETVIASGKCTLDGIGDGIMSITMSVFIPKKKGDTPETLYSVIFRGKDGFEHRLRAFPRLVSAVRSWRRFIVLSEEIERGYV